MTVAPLVDHAARERITTTGLRDTLFVEAGAGTGKTSTLVDRIVRLVLHEQIPLANLAAITFTEAAAAELRDRVRRALRDALVGPDAIAAARAADALADFDLAAITTLHGFALRILGEHPIEVAIPPRVEVLDEVQSLLAFEDRWQQAVARWQADPAYAPLVVRLWACNVELRRRYGASLQRVAAIFDDNWDRLEDLPPVPLRPPARVDRRPLYDAIDAALAIRAECRDPDDKLLLHMNSRVPDLHALRAVDPNDDDRLITLVRELAKVDHGRAGNKKNWPDVAAAHAAFGAVDDAARALLGRADDDILTIWGGILRDLTVDAATARRDSGCLEFHDLLVLARRLLRTSVAARRALHQRYQRLLLDEFQDTDPIQIELALRIAAEPDDQPADWSDIEPPPGRLFVVGDPKQSIYRFRRADISLFHRAKARFGDDAAETLAQNFRTVEPIVSWVNAVFDSLMPDETSSRPRYRPLQAVRHPADPVTHRVTVFGPEHADQPAAGELRSREAADVAAIVEHIRANRAAYPVADRDGGESGGAWRPASCADITVLIPSRTSLPMLERALAARDLPYRVDTSTLVFDSPEVRELLTVLVAVDDPADSLAVVASLRSLVLACADTELFDWVHAGGSWDYRVVDAPELAAACAAAPRVAEALRELATWHGDARWCEPATLLERIVRSRDVLALGLTQRRPRDVWRRVRFLVDQARQFADLGGGHLRDFVRWAELQRNEGSRVPEPLLPEHDDDAVRIMTFHGAKGLEFPIVILSGLTTRPGARSSGPQVRWDADGRPQLGLGGGVANEGFDVLNDFESEMDADEKLRLLYVGATRARDHLFVSTHRLAKDAVRPDATFATRVARASADYAADLTRTWDATRVEPAGRADVVARSPDPASGPTAPVAAPADPIRSAAAFVEWCERRAALLAAVAAERSVWSPSAIAAAARAAAGSASTGAEAADAAPDPAVVGEAATAGDRGTEVGRGRWTGGTAFGRAVHAVLEHAVPGDVAQHAALAAQAAGAEGVTAATVAAAAGRVLASPTVAAALAAPRHWRELSVAVPVGGVIIEGVVDLLAEIEGELVLVDYKTDRVGAAELAAHAAGYAPQLAAYALALEALTGRPVARAVLVFVGAEPSGRGGPTAPAGVIEYEITDLPAVCAAVQALLDGHNAERPVTVR